MNAVFEKMVEHFTERELIFRAEAESLCVRLDFEGTVGLNRVVAWVDREAKIFQVSCEASVRVPEGCRPSVTEAILRVNYGFTTGRFDMNFQNGELSFHVGHLLQDELLTDEVCEWLISGALNSMNRYLPAFMAVIYANELPEDAIRLAETAAQF